MWKVKERSGAPTTSREKNEYTCINCQKTCNSLYKKYSEGVIRLTECDGCEEVVDKYIEMDEVVLVIDIMLQYIQAYRHLLFNVKLERPSRLFVIFWFSHAYEKWIRERMGSNIENIYDLEWMFYKCVLSSAIEISVFVSIIVLYSLVNSGKCVAKWRVVADSTLFGFYGNVAVVLSIVFRLSDQTPYQVVLQIFLLTSHFQIQRALFPTVSMINNAIIVLFAKSVSTLSGTTLEYLNML